MIYVIYIHTFQRGACVVCSEQIGQCEGLRIAERATVWLRVFRFVGLTINKIHPHGSRRMANGLYLPMKNKPFLLYHYTSLYALHRMIMTIRKTPTEVVPHISLRATHISFLNDLTEGGLVFDVLKEATRNKLNIKTLMNTSAFPFVCSFSSKQDDLNMWRCYADSGKGVCIAFEREIVEQEDVLPKFEKCEYTNKEKLVDSLKQKSTNSEISGVNESTVKTLLHDFCKYKHESFREESEWRIIFDEITEKFETKNGVLTPYHTFRVPVNSIFSITLGPKCDAERNTFSLRRLIDSKCYEARKIEINYSKLPIK